MGSDELRHVLVAILLMFVVSGLSIVISGDYFVLGEILVFSVIVVGLNVLVKKGTAYLFDSSVEHRIWHVYRYGWKPKQHFKQEVPFGTILPLFLSAISLGIFKAMSFLTYETRALKHRAAKRFGYYSYTEMTDWHNGLIGATGIVIVLLVSLSGYLFDFEYLAKMAAFYVFWNILPVSNLDGTQIFFGSKIIWTALAFISLLFALYAFFLPA